jgi:hypothetical protein
VRAELVHPDKWKVHSFSEFFLAKFFLAKFFFANSAMIFFRVCDLHCCLIRTICNASRWTDPVGVWRCTQAILPRLERLHQTMGLG